MFFLSRYVTSISTAWIPCASINAIFPPSIQLRWSPSDPNLLSSAHDGGDLRLWDIRQPSLPVRFLLAHGGAGALSLDWGARGEDGESGAGWLVTSGLDCLLKLFDPSSEMKEPLGTLKTSVPVWKTRF